jgi:hypothetical protein
VSVLFARRSDDESLPAPEDWFGRFYKRLSIHQQNNDERYQMLRRTGEALAGDLTVAASGEQPTTAVVSVITDDYLAANTGSRASGELAQFFDDCFGAARGSTGRFDPEVPPIFFLAPLQPLDPSYRIRGIFLTADPRLVRLREPRFTLPKRDNDEEVSDQIVAAVQRIFNIDLEGDPEP